MLNPGQRSNRVRFERRVIGDKSPSGNVLEAWVPVASAWAAFRPQFGRERLAAGRLESAMLGTLTVLAWAATRGLTAADRVVFTAGPYTPRIFDIRSVVPTAGGGKIELTLEEATR